MRDEEYMEVLKGTKEQAKEEEEDPEEEEFGEDSKEPKEQKAYTWLHLDNHAWCRQMDECQHEATVTLSLTHATLLALPHPRLSLRLQPLGLGLDAMFPSLLPSLRQQCLPVAHPHQT